MSVRCIKIVLADNSSKGDKSFNLQMRNCRLSMYHRLFNKIDLHYNRIPWVSGIQIKKYDRNRINCASLQFVILKLTCNMESILPIFAVNTCFLLTQCFYTCEVGYVSYTYWAVSANVNHCVLFHCLNLVKLMKNGVHENIQSVNLQEIVLFNELYFNIIFCRFWKTDFVLLCWLFTMYM